MVSVFFHWLHTVAAMLWIGGVAFIILTLLPTLRQTVDMSARQRIMGAMVPRFRMIVGASIGILIFSGMVNAWGKVELSTWLSTSYGRTLAVKVLLALILFTLYLLAPIINRTFKNRECGHGEDATCEHDSPGSSVGPKRPDIGVILHAIVLVLGVTVLFFGKILTVQ